MQVSSPGEPSRTAELFVTDGDSGVAALQRAGCRGEFLPWRDVLHDGLVPAGSLAACSPQRVAFICSRGWGEAEKVTADFADRDRRLLAARDVCLVFGAELYDQLQLLQILTALADDEHDRHFSLVHVPGLLGWTEAADLARHCRAATPASKETFSLAREAWQAFTAPEPSGLLILRQKDLSALPQLADALDRLCLEFPSVTDGLSQTERLTLRAIADGASTPKLAFRALQRAEPVPFMGDWSFATVLADLARSPGALLEIGGSDPIPTPPEKAFFDRTLKLTDLGRQVLAGKANRLDQQALVDRYLGGVHLVSETCWCWDAASSSFRRRTR